MKHLSLKIGSLGIALLVLLAFSTGFADDFSDFERLFQDALRTNQNSAAADSQSGTSPPIREPQPIPSPGGAARTITTRPIAPNGNVATARAASPMIVIDGWTTVEPNDPSIVVPEPQVVLPPPAILSAEELPADFLAEQEAPRVAVELFDPDPTFAEIGRNPAAGVGSEPPLSFADLFDVEYIIIDKESGENLSEAIRGVDIGELGIITEPRRMGGETREPFPVAPVEKGELSDLFLDDLANIRTEEEASESETPAPPDTTQVVVTVPDFDCYDDDTVWRVIDPTSIGNPYAVPKLRLLYDEVMNGMRTRNISNRYDMWRNFARGIMRDTAGINTRSELDGRWRLNWFLHLYEDPIRSMFEAEEYSRILFAGLSGGHRHLAELMPGIRQRMDVPAREGGEIRFPLCTTPQEALAEVKRCLLLAASAHARAFSTLTPAELRDLGENLVPIFVGQNVITGHTVPLRSVGRGLVDVFARVDMSALYDGAEALIPLTNEALLDLLVQFPDDVLPQVMIGGQRFQRLTTSAGDIIIGGRGRNNTFDLDSPEMRNVICVISFGEHDTFREGVSDLNRPVLVVMALGQQNTFIGTRPGIQGASIMGISMLLDRGGNSTYRALDVAQGSTIGGVGILINYSGGNRYEGRRRVQGHAMLGLGMLIDRGPGDAFYKAAMWAQGFGAPGGFGIISNSGNGNNHFYCGGLYLDSYPEHPGYDGWGQGVGAGLRQVANGGIGIILSGTGDDVYEVDYFGHGGGYWLGVGIARDFGGNDIRHGTTLTTFDGRPRGSRTERGAEARWTRFVNGWGCHYAVGYLFDDGGDDVYGGQIMGTGMAWDLAYGLLADFGGSDRYTSPGNMKHGVGAEASIGILFSYGGDDVFAGRSMGIANPRHEYHPAASGGNFSFLVNYGGRNQYGTGNQRVAQGHSFVQRGTPSGFLIDRPTESEAAGAITALRQAIEVRNQEIAEFDAMIEQRRAEAAARRQPFRPPNIRRPVPISETQLIGAVPDFGTDHLTRRAEITAPGVDLTEPRAAATPPRTGATQPPRAGTAPQRNVW